MDPISHCRRGVDTEAVSSLELANSNTPDFFDPDQVGGIATKVLPSGRLREVVIQERGPSAAARQASGPNAVARGSSAATRQARGPKNDNYK